MKKEFNKSEKAVVADARRNRQLLFVAVFGLFFVITAFFPTAGKTPIEDSTTLANQKTDAAAAVTPNYGVFSHSVSAHQGINCNSCHQRTDDAAAPKFAPHAACTDCHLAQFVTPETQMCLICHSDVSSAPSPMRSFPAYFNEHFNMKFDHAAHLSGEALPAQGCAACHQPLGKSGVALSIPVNLAAHNQCYSCHTPERVFNGRDIGSCNTCHSLDNYRRTSTGAKAFQASFSHAAHGRRQKLSCNDCHSVKANMPQSKQVTAPAVAEHFSAGRAISCMTCHNDRRAFGENDFANCKRCHTGASFAMKR